MDNRIIEGHFDAYLGHPWHYARNKIAIAARAAGIDAIDGAFPDYKNLDGYRRECTRSKTLGFVGKWAIHPGQIDVANQVYAPSQEEVDYARKLDALYREAQEKGLGALVLRKDDRRGACEECKECYREGGDDWGMEPLLPHSRAYGNGYNCHRPCCVNLP